MSKLNVGVHAGEAGCVASAVLFAYAAKLADSEASAIMLKFRVTLGEVFCLCQQLWPFILDSASWK